MLMSSPPVIFPTTQNLPSLRYSVVPELIVTEIPPLSRFSISQPTKYQYGLAAPISISGESVVCALTILAPTPSTFVTVAPPRVTVHPVGVPPVHAESRLRSLV